MTVGKALALLCAVAVAAAGCDPVTGKPSSNGHNPAGVYLCNTKIKQAPTLRPSGHDVAITASARSVCDRPVTRHHVQVFLERQVRGGNWTYQQDVLGGGGVRTCDAIPGRVWTTCTQTFFGCISGAWRVRVTVDWASTDAQGKPRSGSFEVPEQPVREIQCPGPKG